LFRLVFSFPHHKDVLPNRHECIVLCRRGQGLEATVGRFSRELIAEEVVHPIARSAGQRQIKIVIIIKIGKSYA